MTICKREMIRILNKLSLPVRWRLPNGLKVTQNYLTAEEKAKNQTFHIS